MQLTGSGEWPLISRRERVAATIEHEGQHHCTVFRPSGRRYWQARHLSPALHTWIHHHPTLLYTEIETSHLPARPKYPLQPLAYLSTPSSLPILGAEPSVRLHRLWPEVSSIDQE
jgi:hypothetical protein